jgi:hypothetical protein
MFISGVFLVGVVGLLTNGAYATGEVISASAVVADVTYTQGAQTVSSAGTTTQSTVVIPTRFVNGVYVNEGVYGQQTAGFFNLYGYGLGGNVGALTKTQGAQTAVIEGTTGSVGVSGAVAVTQGAQTLSSAGTGSIVATFSKSQGAQTLASASTSDVLNLVMTGQVDIAAAIAYTQGEQTLSSHGTGGGSDTGVIAGAGYTQGAQTTVSVATVAITATLSITQDAQTLISSLADVGDRSLILTLRNRSGTAPVAGTYRYAFFTQSTVNSLGAPTHRGAVVVNTNGTCVITLPDTSMSAGDVGYLVMSDSDGSVNVQHRQLSAPVTVS